MTTTAALPPAAPTPAVGNRRSVLLDARTALDDIDPPTAAAAAARQLLDELLAAIDAHNRNG